MDKSDEVYSKTGPNKWEVTSSGDFTPTLADESYSFLQDYNFEIFKSADAWIGFYFTGVIQAKKKAGTLKKASFQAFAAEVYDGSTNGTNMFVGGAKVKGKNIHVSKLPFTP